MPSHGIHCAQSRKKYGKSFNDLHKWMDSPSKLLGSKHRILRHDIKKTPIEAKKIFGELADQACIDHILLDYEEGDLQQYKHIPLVIPRKTSRKIVRK